MLIPPTNAASTPNARAAFSDDDAPSLAGRDATSLEEAQNPVEERKLKIPMNRMLTLYVSGFCAVITVILMNRQEATAREERTNPVNDKHHSNILDRD